MACKSVLDTLGGVPILVASLPEFWLNRFLITIFVAMIALQGCKSDDSYSDSDQQFPTQPSHMDNEVIATVRGQEITQKDLQPILMQGYGLNVLLTLVQLDLARDEAAKLQVVVTPVDVEKERQITLNELKQSVRQTGELTANTQPSDQDISPEQAEQMLDQMLQEQHVSRAEFDILLEVNANLRKIAEPEVSSHITDDAVHERFNMLYGEKVVMEYIVCGNMVEAADVRRDLAQGKSFEDVARARSRDRQSAANGGELPPFTLHDNRFPPEFRQLSFMLKIGQVSDPIQIGQFIYIGKLIDKIPPQHAKFEDYADSVRKDLYDEAVKEAMAAMRQRLGTMALDSLQIRDPVLRQQWDDRVTRKDGQIRDMQEIRQKLDAEHSAATAPSDSAATQPAAAR